MEYRMQFLTYFCMFSLVYGGGVTKTPSISDFWTDDYKIFEQVYGKTSDKDLYSENLPISQTNLEKFTQSEASEKKEKYITNHALSDFDSYSFRDRYANIFAKQILNYEDKTIKPPKSFNFVSFTNSNPISQYSDPETYNYLKHLEQYSKKEKNKIPKGVVSYKPIVEDSEENQAYKSIQDILDAHEANKSGERDNDHDDERDEQIKYLTYGSGKGRKKSNTRKKPGGEGMKSRCWSGRCRKRATSSVRVRTRPYVRKITQNRWISG